MQYKYVHLNIGCCSCMPVIDGSACVHLCVCFCVCGCLRMDACVCVCVCVCARVVSLPER